MGIERMRQLIKGKRETMEAVRGGTYSQRSVAKRAGITVKTLWGIENDIQHLPRPEILEMISRELDTSVPELLQAAGYNVGLEVIDEAAKLQAIKHTSLADFVRVNYGVRDTDILVQSIELAIKGQLQTEAESKVAS